MIGRKPTSVQNASRHIMVLICVVNQRAKAKVVAKVRARARTGNGDYSMSPSPASNLSIRTAHPMAVATNLLPLCLLRRFQMPFIPCMVIHLLQALLHSMALVLLNVVHPMLPFYQQTSSRHQSIRSRLELRQWRVPPHWVPPNI